MKLHVNDDKTLNLFTSYGESFIEVNKVRYHSNLLVQPQHLLPEWTTADFANLCEADFQRLAELGTEILLLGTGSRLRFPQGVLLRPIANAGIGLEVMDVGAACRTYNILANEGRNVTAALLLA